jgi:hypothetical protein
MNLLKVRFWGTRENGIEAARAEQEGQNAPGLDASKSSMDSYMQGVAHRNSVFSQLKFCRFQKSVSILLGLP